MGVVLEMLADDDVATSAPTTDSTPADEKPAGEVAPESKSETGQVAEVSKPEETTEGETESKPVESEPTIKVPDSEEEPPKTDGPVLSDESRKYQADRDRAEQQLKDFYKQVMPFVEVDQYGRITGPRQAQQPVQQAPEQPQIDVNQLLEAAAAGDKDATQTLLWVVKEQSKREAKEEIIKEFSTNANFAEEKKGLQKDFPDFYKKDDKGNQTEFPDEKSPLFQETLKVITQRPGMNANDPRDVRMAAEIAESRLIKAGLPDLEKRIRSEVATKKKQVGGSSVGISSGGASSGEDLKDALTDKQVSALKKEGRDDDGVKRIARIVKQAKKEGGFYL